MKILQFKAGEKHDIWFAIEPLLNNKLIITRVFTNIQKCLDYIAEKNKGKWNEKVISS